MGTRATVKFFNTRTKLPIVSVYHQFDGYPSGVGQELVNFLNKFTMVNGLRGGETLLSYANGIGCLAAQYVADQKRDVGGVYLMPIENDEEYNYEVRLIGETESSYKGTFFEGNPKDFKYNPED
jgi:hypothetical protein